MNSRMGCDHRMCSSEYTPCGVLAVSAMVYSGTARYSFTNRSCCPTKALSTALAAEYGVSSIPCVVILKQGQTVGQSIGFQPKAALQELLKAYL